MQLIHKTSKKPLIEFLKEQVLFYNPILEKMLRIQGIAIPLQLQEKYQQKAFVKLGDPLFQKAFCEIYCPQYFGSKEYEWKSH